MQSQRLLNNTSVFTEKFYQDRATITETVDLGFPLPHIDQANELETFFIKNPNFKSGLMHVIDSLYRWLVKQGCKNQEKVDLNLKKFKHDFIDYSGTNSEINASVIHLYHYGTVQLYQILQLIENEKIPLATRRLNIENLFLDFPVCGPGAYTHIQNAYIELASSLDIATQFKNIRTMFARQILAQFIQDHTNNLSHTFNNIRPGLIIHYINATVNAYAKSLNLYTIEDKYTAEDILDPQVVDFLKRNLPNLWEKNFLGFLLKHIIEKFNLDEFAKNPTMQIIERLQKDLDQYGVDEDFKWNLLFDQDALADDEFKLVYYTMTILTGSLIKRLCNSGYISRHEVKNRIGGQDFILYTAPELFRYSYNASTQQPFVVYAYEALYYKRNECDDEIRQLLMKVLLASANKPNRSVFVSLFCAFTNKLIPTLNEEEAERLTALISLFECEYLDWRAILSALPNACTLSYLKNREYILQEAATELPFILQLDAEKSKMIITSLVGRNIINLQNAFNLPFNCFVKLYESVSPETVKAVFGDFSVFLRLLQSYNHICFKTLFKYIDQNNLTEFLISPHNNLPASNYSVFANSVSWTRRATLLSLLNSENIKRIFALENGELYNVLTHIEDAIAIALLNQCDQETVFAEFGSSNILNDLFDSPTISQSVTCAIIEKLGSLWFEKQLKAYLSPFQGQPAACAKFADLLRATHTINDDCYFAMLVSALDKKELKLITSIKSINEIVKFIYFDKTLNDQTKGVIIRRFIKGITLNRLFSFAKSIGQCIDVISLASEVGDQFIADALQELSKKVFKKYQVKTISKLSYTITNARVQLKVLEVIIKQFPNEINQTFVEDIFKFLCITAETLPAVIALLGNANFSNHIQNVTSLFQSIPSSNKSFICSVLTPLLLNKMTTWDISFTLDHLDATDFLRVFDFITPDLLISRISSGSVFKALLDRLIAIVSNGSLSPERFAAMGTYFTNTNHMNLDYLIQILQKLNDMFNATYAKLFLESFGFDHVTRLVEAAKLQTSDDYSSIVVNLCRLNPEEAASITPCPSIDAPLLVFAQAEDSISISSENTDHAKRSHEEIANEDKALEREIKIQKTETTVTSVTGTLFNQPTTPENDFDTALRQLTNAEAHKFSNFD